MSLTVKKHFEDFLSGDIVIGYTRDFNKYRMLISSDNRNQFTNSNIRFWEPIWVVIICKTENKKDHIIDTSVGCKLSQMFTNLGKTRFYYTSNSDLYDVISYQENTL